MDKTMTATRELSPRGSVTFQGPQGSAGMVDGAGLCWGCSERAPL